VINLIFDVYAEWCRNPNE